MSGSYAWNSPESARPNRLRELQASLVLRNEKSSVTSSRTSDHVSDVRLKKMTDPTTPTPRPMPLDRHQKCELATSTNTRPGGIGQAYVFTIRSAKQRSY